MPLKDFIMVSFCSSTFEIFVEVFQIKFYETVRPLDMEKENLKRTQNILDGQLAATGQDLIKTQKVTFPNVLSSKADKQYFVFMFSDRPSVVNEV